MRVLVPFRRGAPVLFAALMAWGAATARPAAGDLRPIRESDFLCRGQAGRSVHFQGERYPDCAGGHGPSGGIEPRLLDLLNRLQSSLGKPLIVTSGYRCEPHNSYSWAFVAAEIGDGEGVSRRSLHRAGAAADFRIDGVRGLEDYRRAADLLRSMAQEGGVWTKIYGPREVRDPDNRHDFPYIHVHLRGAARRAAPPAEAKEAPPGPPGSEAPSPGPG